MTTTTRLLLTKPEGTDRFSRTVLNTNYDLIDTAVASLQDKQGTGASTPVANSVLAGTGAGVSAWSTSPTLGGLLTLQAGLTVSAGTTNLVGNLTTGASSVITLGASSYFKAGATVGFLVNNSGDSVNLFKITNAGLVCINDTANTKMTTGLTINQGAADDEAFALKSSDVAHPMTDSAETDTYGTFSKFEATSGGLNIQGFKDADGAAGYGVVIQARMGEDVDTTKSSAGIGAIVLRTVKTDGGTGTTALAADANAVVIRNANTTTHIFDVDGSAHSDTEWTTFDSHDDVALLNALDAAMTQDPVKTEFGRYLSDYRQQLQDARIVNFYDDGPRAMLNTTRLLMLLTGATRQVSERLRITEERLQLTESKLAALPQGV